GLRVRAGAVRVLQVELARAAADVGARARAPSAVGLAPKGGAVGGVEARHRRRLGGARREVALAAARALPVGLALEHRVKEEARLVLRRLLEVVALDEHAREGGLVRARAPLHAQD